MHSMLLLELGHQRLKSDASLTRCQCTRGFVKRALHWQARAQMDSSRCLFKKEVMACCHQWFLPYHSPAFLSCRFERFVLKCSGHKRSFLPHTLPDNFTPFSHPRRTNCFGLVTLVTCIRPQKTIYIIGDYITRIHSIMREFGGRSG